MFVKVLNKVNSVALLKYFIICGNSRVRQNYSLIQRIHYFCYVFAGYHRSIPFHLSGGHPKPWRLMDLLYSARFYAHHWPLDDSGRTFRDYAQLTAYRLTLMVASVTDISQEMYNPKILKYPLDVKIQGGFIGNSSLTSVGTVVANTGMELVNNVNQMILVDKVSRRPVPLPDWWKNKYAESSKSHQPLKFSNIDKPENASFYKRVVGRSDLNIINTTSWSVYVKFSLDAIYHITKTGTLDSVTNNDEFYLSCMELMYSGPSFEGDILQAFVWRDNSSKMTVIVHIFKENTLLFQGKFNFFEGIDDS